MGSLKDFSGTTFGNWVVLSRVGRNKYGMAIWLCRCKCGKNKNLLQGSFVSGKSMSCGCLPNTRKKIHGYLTNGNYPKEYSCWRNMINRCYNKKHNSYHRYGGNGIIVCDRWRNSFLNFITDMGMMPTKEHSIDRYPNQKGNYEPLNCRWATQKEQIMNSSISKIIIHDGVARTMRDWDRVLGGHVVSWRINNGWDEQTAVSTPIKKRNHD